MATKQGYIKDFNGNKMLPQTTTTMITDVAKEQALSATLVNTPDKNTLGFQPFTKVDPFNTGDKVYYDNKLWVFTIDHAPGDWNAAEVSETSMKEMIDGKANTSGDYPDLNVGNLASWAQRDSLSISDTWNGVVQTAGGDASIDSSKGFVLESIAANGSFKATKLVTTGFNLLRRATAVGNGYYFLVPMLEFGTYGTAAKPNGILFTNSNHENIAPTVYFKAFDDGVPTSETDGTEVSPVVENGKSFYCTSGVGYLIVSGITLATTCAHVAWSRRYDDYVAVDDANDAGSEIDLSTAIATLMYTVGSLSDRLDRISATQVRVTRYNGRVVPTWTDTPVEDEEDVYLHEATISGMLSNGQVRCEDNTIALTVEGTKVSYKDSNATATTAAVLYNLASPTTNTYTLATNGNIEDFGLTYFEGYEGDAFTTMQYAQGYPDAIAQLLANMDESIIPVISQAFAQMQEEIDNLRALIDTMRNVNALDYYRIGVPMVLYSSTAGAPSADNVPDNWDNDTMGLWNGTPRFIGQKYIDRATPTEYTAKAVTNSTSDWF